MTNIRRAEFNKIIKFIIDRNEGGYWDDPSGGKTKYGISKRWFPNVDIKTLTKDEAINIYQTDFVKKYKVYLIQPPATYHYLDMLINAGPKAAAMVFQRSINRSMKFTHKKFLEIHDMELLIVDGIVGKKTLDAQVNFTEDGFILERIKHYVQIAKNEPKLRPFLIGWINRSFKKFN